MNKPSQLNCLVFEINTEPVFSYSNSINNAMSFLLFKIADFCAAFCRFKSQNYFLQCHFNFAVFEAIKIFIEFF